MNDDDLERGRELANPSRTLAALAAALAVAATADDTDIRTLAKAVYDRDLELDAPVLVDLTIVVVGLLATKLGKTPRQVWEQLWKEAPTDQWWRAHARRKDTP